MQCACLKYTRNHFGTSSETERCISYTAKVAYSTVIIDFSRVLIFSHADVESLNAHHLYLSQHVEGYRVLDHFYINDDLLTLLNTVKDQVDVFLFSDSSLHDVPEIRAQLVYTCKEIISADESGYKKSEPMAYTWLLKRLNVQPDQTIFLDDKEANVRAAAAVGIRTIQFINNRQTLPKLRKVLLG